MRTLYCLLALSLFPSLDAFLVSVFNAPDRHATLYNSEGGTSSTPRDHETAGEIGCAYSNDYLGNEKCV